MPKSFTRPDARLKWLVAFAEAPIRRLRPEGRDSLRAELANFVGQGTEEGAAILGDLRIVAARAPRPKHFTDAQLIDLQTDVRRWLDAYIKTNTPTWAATWPADDQPAASDGEDLAGWFPVGPPANVDLRPLERRGKGRGPRLAFEAMTGVREAVLLILWSLAQTAGHRLRRCADPQCGVRFVRSRKGDYHTTTCYQRDYQGYWRNVVEPAAGAPGITFDEWKQQRRPRKDS